MRTTVEEMLLRTDTRVTCPSCEHEFSLQEGFAKKALESLSEESRTALTAVRASEREQAEARAQAIVAERDKAHQRSLAEVRAISEQAFKPQLDALRAQLTESQAKVSALNERENALVAREQQMAQQVREAAKAQAAQLVQADRENFDKQLAEKNALLATMRDEQLQLRREREKLQDDQAALALEVQKQVDQRMAERENVVRTQELEKARLREADLVQMIEGMKATISDLQRKADQGSQQSQGEVLELEIEQGLARQFPLDIIEEVKKGQRGGDVIQRVMTRAGQSAGVVLWEMKRAKDFSPSWTAKLKEDMRGCDAHLGVLVTMSTAVPRDWSAGQQFGLVDDVWVCTWGTALPLAEVLRASILDVHKQRIVSAGKGEKMEAVYDYVTSPQFAQKLRAVYDTFQKMREELETERNTTQQRWARREKQLQAGVASLLGIGGDVQGLAQLSGNTLELQAEPPATDQS